MQLVLGGRNILIIWRGLSVGGICYGEEMVKHVLPLGDTVGPRSLTLLSFFKSHLG